MKLGIISILFTFISFIVWADDDSPEAWARYLAQKPTPISLAPKVIEQYANSIGCSLSFNHNNILEHNIVPGNSIEMVALVSLDIGCSGGSRMNRPIFIVAAKGGFDPVFVNPEYSLPSNTSSEFPQNLVSIFMHDNEIWFNALEYDGKDSNCCPSIKKSGRVLFVNGEWKPDYSKQINQDK